MLIISNFFLADVDLKTGQISSKTILDCIKKNRIKNLKVVVTSYLGGHVFDLENIVKLKKNIAPPALSKPFWGIFRMCAPYGQGGL